MHMLYLKRFYLKRFCRYPHVNGTGQDGMVPSVQRCRVLRIISFASLALAYVFLHVHLALAVQKVKVKVDSTFLDCGL